MKPWVVVAFGAALWMMSHSSSAACLRKPIKIDAARTASSLVLAPEREVSQYEAQGYTRVECPADRNVIRGYVQGICDGLLPNSRSSSDLATNFARMRARACASARAALAESGG